VVDQVQLANILETGVKNLNKDLQSLIWNSVLLRNCRTTVEQLWNNCGTTVETIARIDARFAMTD
jgi:hypothetical protein